MKRIFIYDTTLRDGEQAPGNAMTLSQKIELFELIDGLGVDYIDVGFPASSALDFTACQTFSSCKRKAKISALARANKADIATAFQAFNGNEHVQLQVLLLGSEIHAEKKRKITLGEAVNEAAASVRYAKELGLNDISVALEDASRGSYDYLKMIIDASLNEGATTVVLPDTVGFMIPEEVYNLVSKVKEWVGGEVTLSIHCHNDMGLATANTLAAVKAGASCIQTTLCGIGERAGNTALEEVLTVLEYKSSYYQAMHTIDLKKLHLACQALINTIKLSVGKHKPIIGENAFSTAAGIHIHGLLEDPVVYEFVQAEAFNQKQKLLVSRHAGKSTIRNKLEQLGITYDDYLVKLMCEKIKNSEDSDVYNLDHHFLDLYWSCKI